MVMPDDATRDRMVRSAKRVCLFAHFHHLGLAGDHTLYYLSALREAGFATIVTSTATMAQQESERLRDHCTILIERENHGLDFGGWAEALRRYPDLAPDLLLLTNDSVYGPITDLSTFIEQLIATPADFYGAVETLQISAHLQSWFVLLRPSAYQSAAFRQLMAHGPSADIPKFDIIRTFEAGMSNALVKAGLSCHAAFSPRGRGRLVNRWPINPMQSCWRTIIEQAGVPFLKIELLRHNPAGVDTRDALNVIVQRNPALAALVRADIAQRAFAPVKTSRFYWRAVQSRLALDIALPPRSSASMINAVLFRAWWIMVQTIVAVSARVKAWGRHRW